MASIELALKRFFDLMVAAMALLCLSPIIGLIALAIKLDDGGPVLFIQERVGRCRRNFRCYKFRTMVLGAEKIGHGLTVVENDSRITRVGQLLRLWTLDEIPQLFNVLKGDMSIVGPRPWVAAQAAYCPLEDARRFNFKPGMAGWAWIHGRNSLPWEERVRLDLWYVDNWTLSLDFSILVKAFVLLIRREGVYVADGQGRTPGPQADHLTLDYREVTDSSSFIVHPAQDLVVTKPALQAVQED
jgi:undecaprenyl phosphate N,N'-diacetylbacillosamine 1-phosphate transferase